MSYIYVITNDINGKQYVGKTNTSIQQRFRTHYKDSKRRVAENRPLYRAINKYGISNFSIQQLEECSEEEASDREIYWIEKLGTYYNGYNATFGGDGKTLFDYDIIVDKYLELKNQKETAKFFGCDPDTVKRACEGKNIEIISSQEVSLKKYGKPVYQIDKQTGEIINQYNSLHIAARALIANNESNCKEDTAETHISEVCRDKRKSFAGYKWAYVSDEKK